MGKINLNNQFLVGIKNYSLGIKSQEFTWISIKRRSHDIRAFIFRIFCKHNMLTNCVIWQSLAWNAKVKTEKKALLTNSLTINEDSSKLVFFFCLHMDQISLTTPHGFSGTTRKGTKSSFVFAFYIICCRARICIQLLCKSTFSLYR